MRRNLNDELHKLRDYVPISSQAAIEAFMRTSVYQDFMNELIARKELMKDYFEDCSKNEYLETKGGLRAMNLVMGIFDDLLHNRKSIDAMEDYLRRQENVKEN